MLRRADGGYALKEPSSGKPTEQEQEFLAPEMFWNGEKSPAADVYSLGLLLYYAVCGARLPFSRSGAERGWFKVMRVTSGGEKNKTHTISLEVPRELCMEIRNIGIGGYRDEQ